MLQFLGLEKMRRNQQSQREGVVKTGKIKFFCKKKKLTRSNAADSLSKIKTEKIILGN